MLKDLNVVEFSKGEVIVNRRFLLIVGCSVCVLLVC